MRVVLAMLRAAWLSAVSYRLQLVFSVFGLLVSVVPMYFVTGALQGVMAGPIHDEGHNYFGFVLLGVVTSLFLTESVNALPGVIGGTIGSGTLDTMLSAPTPAPVLFAGMSAYGYTWATARAILLLATGALLGAPVLWAKLGIGVLLMVLIVLAYLPVGIASAAMVVAFRTGTPLGTGVIIVSTMLGGMYYPTHVIPSWLKTISYFVPLTYGLRAMRRTMLDGATLASVAPDIGMLLIFAAVLLPASIALLLWAFGYARRAGTLSQY